MYKKYISNFEYYNGFFIAEEAKIPGMAPEDRIEGTSASDAALFSFRSGEAVIPGLDVTEAVSTKVDIFKKKAPTTHHNKPIPKNFMASWNETGPVEEGRSTFIFL